MNLLLITLVITAVAMVMLAWYVVFIEYPRSAIDATRNQLFDIRDRLFELARSGTISFDNRGYKAARELLNGMIRYAHDVSAIHLLFASRFAGSQAKQLRKLVNRSIQQDIDTLPKAAKKPVSDLLGEASLAMARLVIFRSVGLSCVFAVYVAVHGALACYIKARQIIQHRPAVAAEAVIPTNNVEESMKDAINHGPMKSVPTLIRREAGRYTSRNDKLAPTWMPQAA